MRVDLDPVLSGAGLANHPAMLGERLGVALRPELAEQLRRVLDVREEEGDRAGGKLGPHLRTIMRRRGLGQSIGKYRWVKPEPGRRRGIK